eukprot:Gb_27993 [translate_table: standard]
MKCDVRHVSGGLEKLVNDNHWISYKDETPLFPGVSSGVALRNEGFGGFISMIVNHGSYKNLPHMHLKIWVDDGMHKRAKVRWTERRRQLWARLELLTNRLPKKRALCVV